jgi:hypothetical protein
MTKIDQKFCTGLSDWYKNSLNVFTTTFNQLCNHLIFTRYHIICTIKASFFCTESQIISLNYRQEVYGWAFLTRDPHLLTLISKYVNDHLARM